MKLTKRAIDAIKPDRRTAFIGTMNYTASVFA